MRSLDELNAAAWITGRRRDQGGERSAMAILEVDKSDQSRYKVNPLANWSFEEIWEYIDTNEVPYNPLHDRGYKSVGDYMTTAPVDQGAVERSGRCRPDALTYFEHGSLRHGESNVALGTALSRCGRRVRAAPKSLPQ